MMNLIHNLQKKIDRSIHNYNFVISTWGNNFEDSFRNSFDFTNFQDSFFPDSNVSKTLVNVILISGEVNPKMLAKLKEYLDKQNNGESITVRLRGALEGEPFLDKNELRVDLENEIAIDLDYKKFPYDINEIIQAVIDLRDGIHEK